MDKRLEQKRGPNLRKYVLENDRIFVETKTLQKNEKYEIKLDSLGTEIAYKSDSTIIGKVFFCFCLTIPIALTVALWAGTQISSKTLVVNYVVWLGLALLGFLKQSQDDIYLTGGPKSLVFYRAIPTEKEVLEFINEITAASKNYMRGKYAAVDPDIPRDMFIGRLNWLKEKNVINEPEY
jgi:hypothetical protein